jgi:integrase
MAVKKTNRLPDFLRDLSPPPAGNTAGYRLLYDPEIRGFSMRITRTGIKSWVHNRNGRSHTIGRYPDWSYEQAAERAKEMNRRIDDGEDPHAEHDTRRTAPTVTELITMWRDDVNSTVPPRLKPSTMCDYGFMISQWIEPYLGEKRVVDVTRDDLRQLHKKITLKGRKRVVSGKPSGTPGRADRVLSLISALLSFAVTEGLCADNAAKGVRRNGDTPRERSLTDKEFERLLPAIAESASSQALTIILMTGSRRSEVLGMEWAEVDLDAGTWLKPASRTKRRKSHPIPLIEPVKEILIDGRREQEAWAKRYNRPASRFVFPTNGRRDQPVREIKSAWATVCRRAGLTDFRLHDLRHAFASYFASKGVGLPLIGRMLGHSQIATTARYSHVDLNPVREEMELFGEFLRAVGKGRGTEAAPLPDERRAGAAS